MRSLENIVLNKAFKSWISTDDGGSGMIHVGIWDGTVVWSYGAGWEHVSVAPSAKRITPSWDDMCKIKDIFWPEDEAVIQIHPPKENYVNNLSNCLHLWRCTYKDMILPPSILVGVRSGMTLEQIDNEIAAAYELAGEKY